MEPRFFRRAVERVATGEQREAASGDVIQPPAANVGPGNDRDAARFRMRKDLDWSLLCIAPTCSEGHWAQVGSRPGSTEPTGPTRRARALRQARRSWSRRPCRLLNSSASSGSRGCRMFCGVCGFSSILTLATVRRPSRASVGEVVVGNGATILQGPAPFGPVEIHQHRPVGLEDVGVKAAVGDRGGLHGRSSRCAAAKRRGPGRPLCRRQGI